MHDFVGTIKSIFTFMGAEPDFANKLTGWLKDDGFVDVQDRLVPTKHGAQNPDPILASRGVFSTTTAAKSLAQFGKSKYWKSHPFRSAGFCLLFQSC